MGIREDKKEQRRKDIINAGLDLFVTKGYSATKISDIASAANMSMGLLFHYFESKEKLYEELIKIGLQGMKYPMSIQSSSALEFIEIFTEQLFISVKNDISIAKIFALMADAQRSEGIPKHIKSMVFQVDTIKEFIAIIEKGQQDGDFRTGNPLTLSYAFWCSIQGIMEQYAAKPEMDLPEAEWIVDILRGER